jgi:uncharacterized protein with GYD domain
MPKFLITGSYTAEGARGLMKEGGSGRRAAVQKALDGVGGKLEAFYFAFGKDDTYVIVDVPDTASVIAVSLAVNASGVVRVNTTPLISPDDLDAASKKSIAFRAPGA